MHHTLHIIAFTFCVFHQWLFVRAFHKRITKHDNAREPSYPWTFDNDLFGGPDFWGLVSREWRLCRVGRLQSPINIDPSRLLFDPHLMQLSVATNRIEATFRNIGQFPVITAHTSNTTEFFGSSDSGSTATMSGVNISGGPAFPYSYQFHQAVLHFGRTPLAKNEHHSHDSMQYQSFGSEHTIDQIRFPAEVQLLAFNSDLYENFTQAVNQPKGLLAIAIIVNIGESTNDELRRLIAASRSITYKNRGTHIRAFDAAALMPKTEHFVTYEGSLTFPGCEEGVIWVVMNSPIYITREDLETLNELQQREENDHTQQQPLPMSGNFRPLRPLNGRLLRTNINVKYKSRVAGSCPSNIYLDMGYKTNPQQTSSINGKNNNTTSQQKMAERKKEIPMTKIGTDLISNKVRKQKKRDIVSHNYDEGVEMQDEEINELTIFAHFLEDQDTSPEAFDL